MCIPVLYAILQEYEREHQQSRDKESKTLPRLFSLAPQPSLHFRFVTVNTKALKALLHIQSDTDDYDGNLQIFNRVFDLDKYDFRNINCGLFTNQILTDGYGVVFQFARSAKSKAVELELEDFTTEEINNYYRVCVIDPGVRHLYTASYGAGETEHEVRRCSSREYYCMTGSPQRGNLLLKRKKRLGIDVVENKFPTGKTCNINQYYERVDYFFMHKDQLFSFYVPEDGKRRFRDYQGKQRPQKN
ncbi:hypothetical protein DFQ30_004962 [Apophysomyces sp. BC1015]|nr:hypothetical protein DFQ30_004962 [Apophysomyces sp. BC1015]